MIDAKFLVITAQGCVGNHRRIEWNPTGTGYRHVWELCTHLSSLDSAHCWPISLPLWRVIQLPAVIQIITFTLMPPPLSLSQCFLCFLCLSLSPDFSTGNWEWAIKHSQTCAAWETRGRAIYCPLIYYKSSLLLLCGVCVWSLCLCGWEITFWDKFHPFLLIILLYVPRSLHTLF